MRRIAGTLTTGTFFCLTAAVGVAIGKGDMPEYVDRLRQAVAILLSNNPPGEIRSESPPAQSDRPSHRRAGPIVAASHTIDEDRAVELAFADPPESGAPGSLPTTSQKSVGPPPAPTILALASKSDSKLDPGKRLLRNEVGDYTVTVAKPDSKKENDGDPKVDTPESGWTLIAFDNDRQVAKSTADSLSVSIPLKEGDHRLQVAWQENKEPKRVGERSSSLSLGLRTAGPTVVGSVPENFAFQPGANSIRIKFSPDDTLAAESANAKDNYALNNTSVKGGQSIDVTKAVFDPSDNSVLLQFDPSKLNPGLYELTVKPHHNVGADVPAKADSPATASKADQPAAASGDPGNAKTATPTKSAAKPATGIQDLYGNYLNATEANRAGSEFVINILKPVGDDLPSESPGLRGFSGPYVTFPEFTEPRKSTDGFNPSDHVETRVSRLYYFRDAARVAQIINRKSKSYNRAAVDMRRQLADKARQAAEIATEERRTAETKAVQAAQAARSAEKGLQRAQFDLATAKKKDSEAEVQADNLQSSLDTLKKTQRETPPKPGTDSEQTLQQKITLAESSLNSAQAARVNTTERVNSAQNRVDAAQQALQTARSKETLAADENQQKTAVEDRAKQDQFRLEVAAAHEDPDTYAPGQPKSEDPVEQVSVSVVGEGLIQLRGPMKGINTIRLMINELDAPVGQVNVAVHTVQVNGEHGDRMESVIGRIEKYIDHSRFLTAQSAQILRNAVVTVASQKAEMAMQMSFGTQEARDQKYLHAFFGKDFIDELQTLDSEFLKTGNKLLTLHSMDSTSLSSSLFLLALAKNSVRQEILGLFQQMIFCDLPRMEMEYFDAGGGKKAYGCGKFKPFSVNARFTSLIGQFNNQVMNDETLTPLQREFIRLAQIFKSRLVTEMEFNARVMERSLIEQRIRLGAGNDAAARSKAQQAKQELDQAKQSKAEAVQALQSTDSIQLFLRQLLDEADRIFGSSANAIEGSDLPSELDAEKSGDFKNAKPLGAAGGGSTSFSNTKSTRPYDFTSTSPEYKSATFGTFLIDKAQADQNCWTIRFLQPTDATKWREEFVRTLKRQLKYSKYFSDIKFSSDSANEYEDMKGLENRIRNDGANAPLQFVNVLQLLMNARKLRTWKNQHIESLRRDVSALVEQLKKPKVDLQDARNKWADIEERIQVNELRDEPMFARVIQIVESVRRAFAKVQTAEEKIVTATQKVETTNLDQVPFDQKKFLDMLIDEAQDKYIELLEGTRAHTANIDNYIKRLTTALDDDLNTQFYHPAFREVRTASRLYDVNLGEIETTSILTNNRTFAKVSPQATMEFDLPKRDILIKEAFAGTKALFDDYGALLQDPTFLALSKLNSGMPTSSTVNGSGSSPVRNVIPGLPSQTDEQILGQAGPGNKQFGSALEALIPDPAIYKFETGTGFEIRPVVQPDGQAVTFHFNYMYTTNVREPVRADEKHLGRVKRHFIDTDVQLSNFELRKVSRYLVALKASRTSRGVPLLEDMPGVGALFRPLPSAESSLQQNLILAQATIFPTLFDLMGLRWAPAVADLDSLRTTNDDFIVRGRRRDLGNRVFDISSSKVDTFLGIPEGERRSDLYRSQESIPTEHPNGYRGPGLRLRDSQMQEGYNPTEAFPDSRGIRGRNKEGAPPDDAAPALESLEAPNVAPLLPPAGASRTRLRPSGIPSGAAPAASKARRAAADPSAPVDLTHAAIDTAPPRPLAKSAQAGKGTVPLNPQAPRRLSPQATSGQVKLSDQPRSPRAEEAAGAIVPAEYTEPATKPQPKKSGFFSRFRKSERE